MIWLIHNDVGLIIAITDDPVVANIIAIALAAHVEGSRQGAWRCGDTLPLFHG